MIEFKNPSGEDLAKSERPPEPPVEEKIKMTMDDMEARINKYSDEEIEKICSLMGTFKIVEGNKREALLGFISKTETLSDAENLDKIISEAEIKMREEE